MASYVVDAEDPFPEGFTVGDIWGSGAARRVDGLTGGGLTGGG